MTNKNNNRPDAEKSDFFDQFSDKERTEIKKIWEQSGQVAPESEVENQEIEASWNNVNARINSQSDSKSPNTANWKWIAAAAVILLMAGAGFLLVPKTIEAPYGQIVSTTLPDGSTIELNSGTQIQYNRLFGYTNRNIKLNGEAYFSVQKGDQPFTVQGYHATVQVTGTKFNVRSWHNEHGEATEVTVSEGQVQFYRDNLDSQSVTINPGHISSLNTDMAQPMIPEKAMVDRITSWRSQKLMFNNKSLMVIFGELERRFDVQITLENTRMRTETLTAYYADPQNIESVLKDICRVKGLQYTKTANGYRVSK